MIAGNGLAAFEEPTHSNPQEDHVYHLTVEDRIDDIQKGLAPNPNRGKTKRWQALETLLDDVRPDSVQAMGISRKNAIYAHPDHGSVEGIYEKNTIPLRRGHQHLAALAINVDPESVLVCDAFTISFIGNPVFNGDTLSFTPGSITEARKYWEQSTTLAQYRAYYDVAQSYAGLVCTKKSDAPEGIPFTFYQPEVLIPGPVHTDRIRWISSSAFPLSINHTW